MQKLLNSLSLTWNEQCEKRRMSILVLMVDDLSVYWYIRPCSDCDS